MARHRIVMKSPRRLLRKNDVEFMIRVNGELMGTLYISRGGLDYRPARGKRVYEASWERLHVYFTGKTWMPTGVPDDLDESDVD